MAEETLLIKLQFDFSQPASTIKEIEKRVKDLTSTLKEIPEEGTPAFRELANSISNQLGVSIEEAENQIKQFAKSAKTEIAKGKEAVSDFNKEIKQSESAANSINAITAQVKTLEKEVKKLDTSTKEFADKSAELNKLKAQLSEIKQQAGVTGRSLTQLAGDVTKQFKGLNRILLTAFGFRAIGQGLRTLGGQFRNLIDEYKDSSEEVKKVNDDLEDLNQTVKDAAVSFIEANQEGISQFIALLKELIPVLQVNSGFILQIAAALALYISRQQIANGLTIAGRIATLAYNAVIGLLTGQIKLATLAQKAFNTATKSNPIGILVTALSAGVAAFALFNRESATARKAQVETIKASQEAGKQFREQAKGLNSLFAALKETNPGSQERLRIINELNQQYPDLIDFTNLETASQSELATAYYAAARALAQQVITKQKAALADEFAAKQAELLARRVVELNDANEKAEKVVGKFANTSSAFFTSIEAIFNPFSQGRSDIIAASRALNTFNETTKELSDSEKDFIAFQEAFGKIEEALAERLARSFKFENLESDLKDSELAANQSNDNLIQQLEKRQKALEEFIKLAIASGKDYSKQLTELAAITQKLTDITDQYNNATRFSETRLQQLTRLQNELQDSIKEAIVNNEDYSASEEQLSLVTDELNNATAEFDKVMKRINKTVQEYADGSLSDLDKQISDLQDKQKNLNAESEQFLILQRQIEEIEQRRAFALELLNTNTQEFANVQNELNQSLIESTNQEDLTRSALERIRLITDATQKGADEIKAIEDQLSEQLKQLDSKRLQDRKNEIQSERILLEETKNRELEKVGNNEEQKLAIERRFAAIARELNLEESQLNIEILNNELDEYKKIQAEKTATAKSEEDKRKQQLLKGLEVTSEISSKVLELISQAQQQQTERQRTELQEAEEAAVKRAQSFGASEAAIQKIREDYAAKQKALERKSAAERKAIAITEALIQSSLAVIRALATGGPPAAIIAGVLAAIQVALIATRKFAVGGKFDIENQPQFAKGAYLSKGRYHSTGGMPIINPITGQKVAEIEKGEGIINRHSMSSNDVLSLTGTPYEIASAINSYKGYGVAFPARKKYQSGGTMSVAKRHTSKKYALGGRYGISSSVVKLQTGALFSTDINAQLQRFNNASETNKLLQQISEKLTKLNSTTQSGFNETPTVTDELLKLEKLKKDEAAAS